ncbi:MAG: acetyl-CoA carboxylase biotin carboxylase subunit family protein [Actinomycetota bacterium]
MSGSDPAFVLFGDLPKLGPYLDHLVRRGLRPLVVTTPPSTAGERRAAAAVDEPDHPLNAVREVLFATPGDEPTVVERVRQWARSYRVRGLFTSGETFVEPANVAADLLGLPAPGLRAGKVCRNKLLQRSYLTPWSPRYELVDPRRPRLVAVDLPAVVKPLRLYSSIGVRRVTDARSLETACSVLAEQEAVLVEEHVSGREVSVESISRRGQVVFESVTLKGTNESRSVFFVEMAHTVPCTGLAEAERRRLLNVHRTILDRLGFGSGMAHGEYRVAQDGRIVLMEVAARAPGGGILALYHLTTGMSLESAVVDVALDEHVAVPPAKRFARQIYLDHVPGYLRDVDVRGLDGVSPTWLAETGIWPPVFAGAPGDAADVRALLVLKARGEMLEPIAEAGNRAVTALFDAPDEAGLDAVETRFREAIALKTSAAA